MRFKRLFIDISLVLILTSICLDFYPDKNEVDVDFSITDINRLSFNDLAKNEEELNLLQSYHKTYSLQSA